MRGTHRAALIAIAVIVIVGAGVVWFLVRTPPAPPPACTVAGATAGSGNFTLSPEQTANAATIAAVGQRLGMPDHAVTVALATAMQESNLANLSGGDRDSAGLFQQRPSQGWGTYAQVTDPVHASTEFYDHLRALPDWQQLTVTEAAQRVQHSAAPDAYAEWEPEARALTFTRNQTARHNGLPLRSGRAPGGAPRPEQGCRRQRRAQRQMASSTPNTRP